MRYLKITLLLIIMLVFSFVTIAQSAESGETYVLRAGGPQPPGDHYLYKGLVWFKEYVEEKSDGQMEVDIYPSNQLGSAKDMAESLRMGTQDVICGAYSNQATYVPGYGFFGTSYLFDSYEHLNSVLVDPEFKKMITELTAENDPGYILLSSSSMGVRHHFNNVRPVKNIEDIQGIKIRVMSAEIETRVWKNLGTSPTPIPYSEVYSAIQAGVVDGAEGSLSGYYNTALYEVAPYLNLTYHQFALAGIWLSEITFNKLPADFQEIVQEGADYAAEKGRQLAIDNEEKYIELFNDMEEVVVSEVDISDFVRRLEPLQNEIADDMDMEDFLEFIRDKR